MSLLLNPCSTCSSISTYETPDNPDTYAIDTSDAIGICGMRGAGQAADVSMPVVKTEVKNNKNPAEENLSC